MGERMYAKVTEAAEVEGDPFVLMNRGELRMLRRYLEQNYLANVVTAVRDSTAMVKVRTRLPGDPEVSNSVIHNAKYLAAFITGEPQKINVHQYGYFHKAHTEKHPTLTAIRAAGACYVVRKADMPDVEARLVAEELARVRSGAPRDDTPSPRCKVLDRVIDSGETETLTRNQYSYCRSVIGSVPYYERRVIVESHYRKFKAYPRE
jgi:hypothetical protein